MKMSKKAIFKATVALVFGVILLALVILLLPTARMGWQAFTRIADNYNSVVIVAVAITVLCAILFAYFGAEQQAVIARPSKIIEVFVMFCISLILCYFIGEYVHLAARPLSFFALLAITLFRRRDAVFLTTVFAIMLLIVDRYYWYADEALSVAGMTGAYASFLVAFCVGLIAVFAFKKIKTRLATVALAFVLYLPTLLIYVVLQLSMDASSYKVYLELLLYCGLDCVLSVLIYTFMLPLFELVFAELTGFRLRELTSDSAKLIKRLKSAALGTYNHSVVVAQLAEACASEIGEDPERARAAAFYHDVGKLKNPEYFAENQSEYDMHKELTPELSVDIIRSHARDGAKLIKKNRLPEFLADVAVEHHGTLPIKYFYAKALKMSDGELNMENYSYSGPTPSSKIAAIIMIADASEAATRSLSDRSPANVEALVRSLIEERIDLDQFANCDITMRELTVIKLTIVSQLTGVYHSRVVYPKITIKKKN